MWWINLWLPNVCKYVLKFYWILSTYYWLRCSDIDNLLTPVVTNSLSLIVTLFTIHITNDDFQASADICVEHLPIAEILVHMQDIATDVIRIFLNCNKVTLKSFSMSHELSLIFRTILFYFQKSIILPKSTQEFYKWSSLMYFEP